MEPNQPFTRLASRVLAGSAVVAKRITTEHEMHLNPHGRRPQKLSVALVATLMTMLCTSKKAVCGSALLLFLFIQAAIPALSLEAPAPPVTDVPPLSRILCNYDLIDTGMTNNGWTKAFEENFNTLDHSIWDVWEGGAYNEELQCYQDSTSNLKVVDGVLKITAKEEAVTCDTDPGDSTQKAFDYTSGRIESKQDFTASPATPTVRMYARIKLPRGYGMWSAFWSYGDDWPKNGEIDILEARGDDHRKYQTNYFYGSEEDKNEVKGAEKWIEPGVD